MLQMAISPFTAMTSTLTAAQLIEGNSYWSPAGGKNVKIELDGATYDKPRDRVFPLDENPYPTRVSEVVQMLNRAVPPLGTPCQVEVTHSESLDGGPERDCTVTVDRTVLAQARSGLTSSLKLNSPKLIHAASCDRLSAEQRADIMAPSVTAKVVSVLRDSKSGSDLWFNATLDEVDPTRKNLVPALEKKEEKRFPLLRLKLPVHPAKPEEVAQAARLVAELRAGLYEVTGKQDYDRGTTPPVFRSCIVLEGACQYLQVYAPKTAVQRTLERVEAGAVLPAPQAERRGA